MKVWVLLCAGLAAAFFAACNGSKSPTSPSITNSVSFSNLAMTPDTIYAVASFFGNVSGTMTGTSTITSYNLTVHDKHGSDVSTSFALLNTIVQNKVVDLKVDAAARVMARSAAPVGKYYVIITAMIGSQSFIDSVAFTVTLQPNLYFDSVVAGSNLSPVGSSIDLDGPAVFTDSTSAANLSTIDLCYAYSSGVSGVPDGDYIFSPDQAKASGFDFTSSWTGTPNSTAFYKLQNFTGADFDTVYTKGEVAALWTDPVGPTPYALCAQGDVFIARTDQGAIALIHITAQTPGAAGTISLKIAD
jgi:hypothetical protein